MPLRPTGESVIELSISGSRRKGITKFRANRWPGKASKTNGEFCFPCPRVVKFSRKFALGQGQRMSTACKGFESRVGSAIRFVLTLPGHIEIGGIGRRQGQYERKIEKKTSDRCSSTDLKWPCLCSETDKRDMMVTFPGSAKGPLWTTGHLG